MVQNDKKTVIAKFSIECMYYEIVMNHALELSCNRNVFANMFLKQNATLLNKQTLSEYLPLSHIVS